MQASRAPSYGPPVPQNSAWASIPKPNTTTQYLADEHWVSLHPHERFHEPETSKNSRTTFIALHSDSSTRGGPAAKLRSGAEHGMDRCTRQKLGVEQGKGLPG